MLKVLGVILALPFLLLPVAQAVPYPVTDLVESAKTNDTHAVHHLIADGTDLAVRGPLGFTALHWAGGRANWRAFTELVAAGAPVNAVGSDGGTPLHWACHHDRAEMIALLLDAGADVGARNRWGRTPLHVAARRGCARVAALLIDRGADFEATTNEGWTPLHVASRSGHFQMVELLTNAGADPDRLDDDGATAAEVWRARPADVEIDPGLLASYEGIYDLGGGFELKVWEEGGRLRVREVAPDELSAVGPDRFACRREPWRLIFERDAAGAVNAVRIEFLRRTVRGTRTLSPRYIGSEACVDCHEDGVHSIQYVAWLRSRHAHAYWRLGADWSLYLAKRRPHYHDLEQPLADHRCRLCHVTGAQDDRALFADSYRAEEGVGCESCHGPGSEYATPEIMSDHAAYLEHGGRVPDASTCRRCHRREGFDWSEMWAACSHPLATPGDRRDDSH